MTVVDYAFPPYPSTEHLLAAGATGVVRYLSWLPNSKVIGAGEYRSLRAAGLGVALVWEYDARDWMSGRDGGAAHAAEAVRQARALGHPAGAGIYGAADWDIVRAEWDRAAGGYAAAFRDGIRAGGYRPGAYGPADLLTWCREIGFDLYWQAGMSTAWSGGRNAAAWPGAHLRQRRTCVIGDADCDLNDALANEWGQGGNDVSERTDAVVAAWSQGVPQLEDGTGVEPVKWRIRDEAWQARVDATLDELTQKVADLGQPTLSSEQLDTIGAAAAGRGAEVLGTRVEDLEEQIGVVKQLLEQLLAALGAAGGDLAALGTAQS